MTNVISLNHIKLKNTVMAIFIDDTTALPYNGI